MSNLLSKGSTGNVVEAWQRLLNSQGSALVVDGIFGKNTASETLRFQKVNGATMLDGIVGPETIGIAKKVITSNSQKADLDTVYLYIYPFSTAPVISQKKKSSIGFAIAVLALGALLIAKKKRKKS